jgi:phosphatidylserine/phosphatidylglycerophosphate/cardiolipin synthase-like enzyme
VAPAIARALAARLSERDGPEIVLVCGAQSPSYFDRLAIDEAQRALIESLRAMDSRDRFRAFTPLTAEGEPIIVHSKAAVIDDRLLRVGSTNLNNRSLGLDTECDLAIDAATARPHDEARAAIARVRDRMLAHHLQVSTKDMADAMLAHGSAVRAIESFRSARLRSVDRGAGSADDSPLRTLIAEYHIGDPHGVDDLWRPWRRVG